MKLNGVMFVSRVLPPEIYFTKKFRKLRPTFASALIGELPKTKESLKPIWVSRLHTSYLGLGDLSNHFFETKWKVESQ